MKRFIIWILIILILGAMAYRFLQRHQATINPSIYEIQVKEGFPVEAETVTLKPFKVSRLYTGNFVGDEEANIVSMIGEYISKVSVKEGQYVTAGQTICELSKDNPSAGYQQAKLAFENAERELKRIQALFEKGAISKQTLDGITLQRDIAKRNLELAERLLIITTPISGKVTNLTAEIGKFATPGIPLAKVVAGNRLRVSFQVPAIDRNDIHIGDVCVVSSGGIKVNGKIERLSLSADNDSRSFTAWVNLEDYPKNYTFSPGLMADIEVFTIDLPEAIVIPPEAIIHSGDTYYVYIINNDKAHKTTVEIGGRTPDAVWVKSGITPGAQIAISGVASLYDGAKIKLINRV